MRGNKVHMYVLFFTYDNDLDLTTYYVCSLCPCPDQVASKPICARHRSCESLHEACQQSHASTAMCELSKQCICVFDIGKYPDCILVAL